MYRSAHTSSPHKQIVAATLVVFLLTTDRSFSQPREVALGTVRTIQTPEKFERCLLLNAQQPERRRLVLWTPGASFFYRTSLPLTDTTFTFSRQQTQSSFDDIIPADINGDGLQELLLVEREEKRILVIENLDTDTVKPVSVIQLPVTPTRVVVGDLNNDKRLDILVSDRNNPGIIPFLGTGKFQFRQAAIIAPDNAVEDMVLLHLNNDLLLDLVFYDWVNSELHFSYGVGRGRFVDLTSQPVEGSVKKILARPFARSRFMDLVLAVEQPPELQFWEGEATGDFHKKSTLLLHRAASDIAIADMNKDGWNDIVLLDRGGVLKVALNAADESPVWSDYEAGRDAEQFVLADMNLDGNMDALVLRRDQKLLLFYNALQPNILKDSLQFATGVDPHGIWLGDIKKDGRISVLLVNRGSNTLSYFGMREEEGLLGQTVVPIAPGPKEFAFHSATDTTAHFFVSYPSRQSISFLTLHRSDLSTVNAVIPDVGEMELLSGSTTANGQAELFCYSTTSTVRSPSLVFYQQLEPKTFIERTFRLTIPDVLLGAGLGDFNNDGRLDVVFAYSNNELKRNELVFSLGDSAFSFRNRYQTLFVPEGNLRKTYMWFQNFGKKDTLDLLLAFPPPASFLAIAKGTKNGKFDAPMKLSENISLNERAQLQIIDITGDKIPDLVLYNSATSTLGYYEGRGDGTFRDWKQLLHSADIAHFAFGDLNRDGVMDLAVTFSSEGRLKIYDGRLLIGERGTSGAR